MNEIFLLKLGEIVLKGGNRFQFENRLKTNVARRKPRKQYVPCDFFLDRKTRLFRRKRHDGFFPYHDKQYRKIQRGNDV